MPSAKVKPETVDVETPADDGMVGGRDICRWLGRIQMNSAIADQQNAKCGLSPRVIGASDRIIDAHLQGQRLHRLLVRHRLAEEARRLKKGGVQQHGAAGRHCWGARAAADVV